MKRLIEPGLHPWRKALTIAGAFALFRLWYVTQVDLAPDESYYWEWSRHLALSYYDQGPMLGLAIKLGTWLAGSNELGVRLMAVLCAFLSSLLGAQLVSRQFKRPELAPWLVLAMNGMLLFSVGAVLMMHDSLMGFFWMLGLVAALRALEEPRWWLAAGLAGGLAILSKYTGVLFFAGVLTALLTRRQLRPHFRSPWLWSGAVLGTLVGLTPIVLWNMREGWPSFQHVAGLAGGDGARRSWATFPEFLSSQFGLVTPILLGLILRSWWQGRKAQDPARWLLWCLGALPFLFFGLLSLRTRIEGNWPAQAYLAGLLLAAWDLDRGSVWARRSLWLALGMTVLVHLQAAVPFLPLRGRMAKADSVARVDGWRELGARVGVELEKLGPDAFVGCRTYQNASSLAFYVKGQPHPLILMDGSINHQYRFWNRPQDHAGKDAILVVGQEWELDEMRRRFASITPLADDVFLRNGAETRRSRLFVGKAFRP